MNALRIRSVTPLHLPLHGRELLSDFTCRVAQIQLLIKEEMQNNGAGVQGEAKAQQPLAFISWDRIQDTLRCAEIKPEGLRMETTPGVQDSSTLPSWLWKAKLKCV